MSSKKRDTDIAALNKRVVSCRLCPRLVEWRERVAREKVKRFADAEYWGKPIPGFGDSNARLILVGLAPAAHGGNRTGRMFTGDESGNWLFRALCKSGFANQSESSHRNDGLKLADCYITATLRCPPPRNKPLPVEVRNCSRYLHAELSLLTRAQVVLGLGSIGFNAAVDAYKHLGRIAFKKRPAFSHGAVHRFGDMVFLASYHPSQQNTFTGKLTEPMFDSVFRSARTHLSPPAFL